MVIAIESDYIKYEYRVNHIHRFKKNEIYDTRSAELNSGYVITVTGRIGFDHDSEVGVYPVHVLERVLKMDLVLL